MFKLKGCFSFFLCTFLSLEIAYPGAPACEVCSFIRYCKIENDKLIQVDTVIIQINDRSGERYANVYIPYSKDQKISDLNAWIKDASGAVIRKLKKADVTDRSYISDFSLYEDDFIKSFSLKHNTYPYRIFYTYKTVSKQFISINWHPVRFNSVPTLNARFRLVTPMDYQFHRYCNKIADPKTQTIGNEICYDWEISYPKQVQNEVYAISMDEFLPELTIVPYKFLYGIEGCSKDWASFGNWQFRLMKNLQILPEVEQMQVSQLIKGVTDKRDIIKILYHYLQDHTRYVNVSIDIGGLRPYPASYVAQNKYGDCKALTNYMMALLEFAGVKSYYTIIYGGILAPDVLEQVSGPQYFNHVILTVPMGNDTVWLENTSNIGPFGYVGCFIQNRKALLIDEFGSKLIKIPAQNRNEAIVSRKIDVAFNRLGDASVDIKATFKGVEFEEFNNLNSHSNNAQKDEDIRKYLTYSNFDLIKWELIKNDRDSKSIQLNLELTFYKWLKSIGNESYFSLVPIDIPVFELPKDRKLPLEFPYPICKLDTIVFKMPIGYVLKTIPEEVKLSNIYGNYELIIFSLGENVQVIRKFELYPHVYRTEQYDDFYKYITAAREADKTKIILKRKE